VQHEIPSGTVIGGEYVVERLLGEGGMGAVYLARQRSTFRLRALKILGGRVITNQRDRDRFAREAMIGSLIESEHVVEVIGAGVDETPHGAVPWLAMEYLEGQELLAHVAGQPGQCMPRGNAHVVLEQVFHAIAAAHRASVVHRDIKPENVFLATTKRVGAPFVIKVLDFGMAKIAPDEHTGSVTVTLGTPGWLAPEQLDAGRSSAASDVWSLGLLTFFVLTGSRFWLGQHDDAKLQSLLYESALSPIPKASDRAAHFGRAALLPADFDDWFARCVARDPSQRFQNAEQAWTALAPLLNLQAAADPSASVPPPELSIDAMARQQEAARAPTALLAQVEVKLGPEQVSAPIDRSPASHIRDAAAGIGAPVAAAITAFAPGPGPEQSLAAAGTTTEVHVHSQDAALRQPGAADRTQQSRKLLTILISAGALIVLGATVALALAPSHGHAPEESKVRPESSVAVPAGSTLTPPPTASASPAPLPDMVALPAGSFQLEGATVHVDPFEIDRTEVTVDQWERCVSAAACSAEVATVNVKGAQAWSTLCNWPRRIDRGDHPINCVSGDQAQVMCRWAKKRLPSEAEWYYAAYVAGGERTYPWGLGAAEPGTVNLCGTECASMLRSSRLVMNKKPLKGTYVDPFSETGPVSALARDSTPAGVIGMGGNVAEWTATSSDGKRLRCRGGSWITSELSAADRSFAFALEPGERRANFGFRCARSGR
jgi:eukaryotic-like serine/threonine-protein kinase